MDVSVSVVVITRDRLSDLQRCLAALLKSSYRDFELVVVDQSTSSDPARYVGDLAANDPRLRLVRDSGRGAARSRNIGARTTTGEVIVFTDDDCEPDEQWLATLVEALQNDLAAGIAFGTVTPAAHAPRDGFIVGFTPARPARLRGRLAKLRDAGISANVAVRRAALEASGGFDEMLGPGSYFPCAEDFDLTYRMLSHGYVLLHVPGARVVHHGLRDWQTGGALIRRTYVAIGAAYTKYVRSGDLVGILLLLQEFWRASANIAANVVARRSPFGFGRLGGLGLGIWRSFELGVETRQRLYIQEAQA